MVYKIKFISEEADGFFREIKIDSDASFLDLSNTILKVCHYPDDQMTSFYVCNEEWERGVQITREDMSDPDCGEDDPYSMSGTALSDFIDDKGQRFEYVFDPFSERSFYLQVKEVLPGEHLKVAERGRSQGEPPVQLQELEADPIPKAVAKGKGGEEAPENDDIFYGDSDFDSEDFDTDGFEISEGKPY